MNTKMPQILTMPDDNSQITLSADTLAYIKIDGPDAKSFLQGQLTVDVTAMQPGDIRYTAQCDAKGKMTGLGFLLYAPDHFLFIQDKATIEVSLAQLSKFGVFAKAEFSLSRPDEICIATLGNAESSADNNASSAIVETPELPGMPGFRLAWYTSTPQTLDHTSSDRLTALFIQNGIGLLKEEMAEEWVPQMLNVQALNGIDFDKGCYMGQEVVARTKYLGKNKRAMCSFTASTSDTLKVGSPVFRQLGENWRKAGTVLSAANINNTLWISAVLPNDVSDNDVFAFDEQHTLIGEPLPLPYVVELEESSVKMKKRTK
jgi:folate-binding protein YgfZ